MNFVVTSTLPPKFGGRTKSLLRRTKLLMEKANMDFTIITTNYKNNYQEIYDLYLQKEYVPDNIKFINIYDYLRGDEEGYPDILHNIEDEDYKVQKVEGRKNAYRYFQNGIFVLYKSFSNPDNRLKFVDFMSPESTTRVMRKEYDPQGYLHREIHYVPNTLIKTQEIMYKKDGTPYINRLYNGKPSNNIRDIIYFKGDSSYFFSGESNFLRFCFEQIIQPNSNVICDARQLDRGLIEANINNCQKILVQHSTFHELNNPSKLRGSYEYSKQHAEEIDRIVLLTDAQRKNWEQVTGVSSNTVTIPHSIDFSRKFKPSSKDRDPNKFVMMGRLDGNKRVNHAIKAFSIAAQKNKDIYLEIYGEGDLLDELKALKKELKLGKRVTFKGRTDQPDAVFQSAKASLFTSKYEGFGLVVLESLINGCPVISYDINYGPNEMIEHNKSGYLVEPKNVDELAEYILKAAKKDEFDIEVPERYSEESFVQKWMEVLQPNHKTEDKTLRSRMKNLLF